MLFTIRPYEERDLGAIARLYYHTVREINAQDYSAEQIDAWAGHAPDEAFWRERLPRYDVYVVVETTDNSIVGFGEFARRGHVDCLYVRHDRIGRGIGKALYQAIEARAREEGCTRLDANVSVTARPFFEALGFNVLRKRIGTHRDCTFELFDMEKHLLDM